MVITTGVISAVSGRDHDGVDDGHPTDQATSAGLASKSLTTVRLRIRFRRPTTGGADEDSPRSAGDDDLAGHTARLHEAVRFAQPGRGEIRDRLGDGAA